MSDKNPPAFPVFEKYTKFNDHTGQYEDYYEPHGGMRLRDYFAAKALTGLMDGGWQHDGNPFNENKAERTASIAYQFADAMLKERAK